MVNFVLLLANGDIKDIQVPLKSDQKKKPIVKLINDKRIGLTETFSNNFENIGKI